MESEVHELDVVVANHDWALAMLGPVMLLHWITGFPPGCTERVRELHDEYHPRFGHQLAGLQIVEPGCSLPNRELRAGARGVIAHTAPETMGIGVLIHGRGFMMSAFQSITLNIFSLTSGVRTRSFTDPVSVSHWVTGLVPRAPSSPALLEAIAKLRAPLTF